MKTTERELAPETEYDSEVTPKNSRQVRDYGKNRRPNTRRRYQTIAKGYANLEFELATKNDKIAAFEAEVARLTKTWKRKVIPNPNKWFVLLSEALASDQPITENGEAIVFDLTRDSRSWATCTYGMRSSYRAGCTVTKNRLIDE
jgi:hypothetical protein